MIKLLIILSSLLLQGLLATTTDIIVIPLKVGSHILEIKNALPYYIDNDKPYFTTAAAIKAIGNSTRKSWDVLLSSDPKSYRLSKDSNGTLVLKYTVEHTASDVSLVCVTKQRECLECKPLKFVNMDKGYCSVQGPSTHFLRMRVWGKDYTLAPTVAPTPSPTPSPDSQVTEPKDSSSANLVSMVSPMLLLLVAGLAMNPYL